MYVYNRLETCPSKNVAIPELLFTWEKRMVCYILMEYQCGEGEKQGSLVMRGMEVSPVWRGDNNVYESLLIS